MSHVSTAGPPRSGRRTASRLLPPLLFALGIVLVAAVGWHTVRVTAGATASPCGHALDVAFRRPVIEPTDFGRPGAWAARCQHRARTDLAVPMAVLACGAVWCAWGLARRPHPAQSVTASAVAGSGR